MVFQANTDILDIEAYHREDMGFSQNRDVAKDISIRQLGNFKTSIYNIKKIQELIQQANTKILDTETNHKKNIFKKDLESLRTYLCQIDIPGYLFSA